MSAKRILVVDDDKDIVQMMTGMLRKARYDVATAADALHAVTQAQRVRPDLVLLDIMMPAGGGLKALESMKTSVHTNTIPVIVITGSIEPGIEEKTKALGVHAFIRKPFDRAALLDVIKEALGEGPQTN